MARPALRRSSAKSQSLSSKPLLNNPVPRNKFRRFSGSKPEDVRPTRGDAARRGRLAGILPRQALNHW